MSIVRTPRPRVKPALSVQLERHPAARLALLHLTLGKETHHYYLSELPSDFGRAFRVEKFMTQGGASYDVLVDPDAYGYCHCLGYLAHGHCKHVDACRIVVAHGTLGEGQP
jgi:hypothetical protein